MTDEGERGERGRKKEMMHGVYEGMFVVGRGWEGWRLRGRLSGSLGGNERAGELTWEKRVDCMGKDFVDMDMNMNTE